jgi:uncharacterized protein YggE
MNILSTRRHSLAGAVAALCLAVSAATAAAQSADSRTLSLTASGSVSAVPDMVRLEMSVSAEAVSASAALEDAARRLAAVFAALDDAGIAAADRQTREIRLDQRHDRDESGNRTVLRGYRAFQAFSVTLRDTGRLGAILDTLTGAGLDGVGGFAFDVADRAALQDEARRRAVDEARRIAGLLAEAAGETLGVPLSMTLLDGASPRPMPMRAAIAEDAAMPVAAGEMTVSASVSVTFALE